MLGFPLHGWVPCLACPPLPTLMLGSHGRASVSFILGQPGPGRTGGEGCVLRGWLLQLLHEDRDQKSPGGKSKNAEECRGCAGQMRHP